MGRTVIDEMYELENQRTDVVMADRYSDIIKRQPVRDVEKDLLAALEEYRQENISEENSGFIDVCIDIVKEFFK